MILLQAIVLGLVISGGIAALVYEAILIFSC